MSVEIAESLFGDAEVTADITLQEHTAASPRKLSDRAIEFLAQDVNGGAEREGDRIKVTFDKDGWATLHATSYVGLVSFPDGPTIEIQPKASGAQLLHLLRYAHGVESTAFEEETRLEAGNVFIEAIAALFEAELSHVLTHGLYTDYRTKDGTEQHLRGRLDLHRQLQRQPPQPTAFECTYDELTPDVTINQAVLFATTILLRLIEDSDIGSALQRHQQQLRRQVTLRPVDPTELRHIETTRLNEYYDDLLRFTEMVLGNLYISELTAGRRSSYSLLVNMNSVFEQAVERAAREAVADRQGWRVKGQDSSKSLVEGGRRSVTLKPDFTVRDAADTVRVVGDAKWKTDSPSNADFYQLTAYQLAHEAPGLLVYPEQGETMTDDYTLPDNRRLMLIELPTASNTGSFAAFQKGLQDRMATAISNLI